VDQLKEKIDELKTQLAEEKISRNFPRGESTTTNVLKQEFKKMVRDMRADQARALRAEQDERRKLESTIRELKKGQLQRQPVNSQPPKLLQAV